MRQLARILCGLALLLAFPAPTFADGDAGNPIGRWRTIDDSTHRPKSIVLLWVKDGVLYGTIEQVFPEPGKPAHPVCDKCEGRLKNQPIEGLTFLWGLEPDDDEWTGGRVLDPANGKTYRCTIQVVDGGERLKVRGYVGVSLFGRTQYWHKVREVTPGS